MTVVHVKDIEISIANRKRASASVLAEGVYVGRPSALGNPYSAASVGRSTAIEQYRDWLRDKIAARDRPVCEALDRLLQHALAQRKLILVCWCAPLACHAEVIADELAKALSGGYTFAGPAV